MAAVETANNGDATSGGDGGGGVSQQQTRVVSATPELREYQLGPHDAYLLIGSDGVFEKLGAVANETMAACVAKTTAAKAGSVAEAGSAKAVARGVVKRAAAIRQNYDDISAVVAKLHPAGLLSRLWEEGVGGDEEEVASAGGEGGGSSRVNLGSAPPPSSDDELEPEAEAEGPHDGDGDGWLPARIRRTTTATLSSAEPPHESG
eukprot:SAG22_NODE_1980_length_3211_cov_1.089010_2_plen_205_part_00